MIVHHGKGQLQRHYKHERVHEGFRRFLKVEGRGRTADAVAFGMRRRDHERRFILPAAFLLGDGRQVGRRQLTVAVAIAQLFNPSELVQLRETGSDLLPNAQASANPLPTPN
jgi:hypothetical protein